MKGEKVMSDLMDGKEADCLEEECPCDKVRLILDPKEKDLGGFVVRRLLPSPHLRMVGPFVFFDHLGPVDFQPGTGIDVRPHPHIGLATVTYVFDGEIVHRDSLGEVQTIKPNEINLMTAGRGIVHSERTGPELRERGHTLHALQLWLALPVEVEQCEPAFNHYSSRQLPTTGSDDVALRVLIGKAFGVESAVRTFSETLYVEALLSPEARLSLPNEPQERAIYLVSGSVEISGRRVGRHRMVIFEPQAEVSIVAREETRLVIIGGEPLGRRTVWWNLVASDRHLIEQAKRDWKEGRFPEVPGEVEFIPLPE